MSSEINSSYIPMLEDRLEKLWNRSFDWAAWKKGTLLVLKNAFGEESAYYKQLFKTDYEYSSWSLRDTAGSGDPVKSSCAELLEICIMDLKQKSTNQTLQTGEILKKFLSSETPDQIEAIIKSDVPQFEKEEKIEEILAKQNSKAVLKSFSSLLVALTNKQ
ncbi:hypothetical protein [Alkalitalea saponilacus]|uniref:Uncharacterized protein n=1 Tax=Alkalitalea saponilacus TaxID=889453 RepID=A0A1T5H880_9BACT|nr:hypothetical protein [Alkalitalea saponilacus]SKC16882.1 hypothetical protein SAMN03080601_02130 [Alkalitalea saponilacus]